MPEHQLLQINIANLYEEKPNWKKRVADILLILFGEAEQHIKKPHAETMKPTKGRRLDDSPEFEESMPGQQLQNINIATTSEMQQNVNVATSSKKAKQNINVATSSKKKRKRKSKKDDDSWMPVGWTKEVKKRGSNGKYPGYEDTFYRAPGVKRAFRSIVEAQRYINKQKKASIVDRN